MAADKKLLQWETLPYPKRSNLVQSQRILRAVQSLEADSGGTKLCHNRLPLRRVCGGKPFVLAHSTFELLLLLWHAAEVQPDIGRNPFAPRI